MSKLLTNQFILRKGATTHGCRCQEKGRVRRQTHRAIQEESIGFRNPSGGA